MGSLIGRDAILSQLCASARSAVNARAATIAEIIGGAGFGKSHLSMVLLDRLAAELPNARILRLRAAEPVGGDSDRTLADLLRRLLDLPARAPADHGQSLLGQAWAPLALVLGWLGADAPELADLAAAPGVLRAAASRATGDALRLAASERPLLVVLDDAQFADDAAIEALEYGALAEAGVPLWVCALGRPAFELAHPRFGDRAAGRLTARLDALAPVDATSLCRHLLLPAENVPTAAVARLVERCQGIPLFLTELVRGLKASGLVRRSARGDSWYLAVEELERLPDLPLVDWLAGRELESLPPDLAAHARLVSVLGAECSLAEISGVLEKLDRESEGAPHRLDPTVATERLVRSGILHAHRSGRVGFRHALVRDAVYAAQPEATRKRIHGAAFRFYRDHPELADAERLPRLARHAAKSGLSEPAAAAHLQLAERARSRHAYFESQLMYEGALAELDAADHARRMQAHRGRGLMRYRLGRHEDALADFDRARQLAHERNDVAAEIDILLDEATALDWCEEFRKSKALVDGAATLAGVVPSDLVAARLLLGMGRSCHRFNDDAKAVEHLAQAARRAEPLGDAGYETFVISLLLLAPLLATLGRPDEAERAFDRVIAVCERRGDRLHLAAALNNRHRLWIVRNRKEPLLDDARSYLAIAHELGNRLMEQSLHENMGAALYRLGDLDAALEHARKAIELEQKNFGDAARPEALLVCARVLAFRGDERGAREIFDRVRDGQARARDGGHGEGLLVPSEEIACEMIDLATRDATDEDWDDLVARAQACAVGQDLIEVHEMRGLAALRRGRQEAARRAFEAALELAERIPNVMQDRLREELARATAR